MRFELRWRERRTSGSQTPRRFLDFIGDGESLYDRHGRDLISCLGWLPEQQDERAAQRLLGREPPDVGQRVAIHICPEDADLLCGVISARIVRDSGFVLWAEPAISWFDYGKDDWSHDVFTDWPELRFDAPVYTAAIEHRLRVTR